MDLHSRIRQSYQNLAKDQVLMIDASQIKLWRECREKHRLSYYLGYEKAQPNIHYMFGSVVHKICEGYWAGRPYMETFHEALKLSQQLDIRKLDSKTSTKWSELCEAIAPITTIYFGYHDVENKSYEIDDTKIANGPKPIMNESEFTWEWGSHAGLTVLCCGVVDRFSSSACLTDTKTASAVGKEWKTDLKKRLLREPQMGFYSRYLNSQGMKVNKIEYEIIVKPYRGSDPRIETIDVTKEVRTYQPTFEQQFDWTIREMCEYYSPFSGCTDAAPWPMSNTACTTSIFGECEYLPACSGKSSLEDRDLYQIREGVTV